VEQKKILYAIELPSAEPTVWRIVRQAKKAILQAYCNISTSRIKWFASSSGCIGRVYRSISWGFQRIVSARWQVSALEFLELRCAASNPVTLDQPPCVMVNCSPFDFRDNQILRAMCRERVPTISIIPSWDNPSTKGCIHTCADAVLVWGEHQKNELLKLYAALDAKRIHVTGIPQFDIYSEKLPDAFQRDSFLRSLGISPNSKIILYATCGERLFPSEPDVVADVVNALNSASFGSNVHLLVRCHPGDRDERYRHLCSNDRVTLFPPSNINIRNFYKWIPPASELQVLAAMLRYCDVCVNTASTMTLDAFANHKPVVNVAYDGRMKLPYLQSVRRYYDYHHYAPIANSGGVSMAYSPKELVAMISESLVNPQRLNLEREKVCDRFSFHPSEGSIGAVIARIREFSA